MARKATNKNCVASVRKSERVMREFRTSGKKYGVELPCNVSQALQLNAKNNHHWRDAMSKEMKAMEDNNVFSNSGWKFSST